LSKEIKGRWWILATVTAAGFLIDWWTKKLAVMHLSPVEPHRIIGHALELVLVHNKAAVFGLDPRHLVPLFPLNQVFTVFHIVAVIVLVVYYRYLKKAETLMHWALAIILPGALGNLFDRVVHPAQGVVDFIKVDTGFWPFNPWPVFNAADAWVTIGVCLMILHFFLEERRKKALPAAGKPADQQTTMT
jgi:signal peptidase II